MNLVRFGFLADLAIRTVLNVRGQINTKSEFLHIVGSAVRTKKLIN